MRDAKRAKRYVYVVDACSVHCSNNHEREKNTKKFAFHQNHSLLWFHLFWLIFRLVGDGMQLAYAPTYMGENEIANCSVSDKFDKLSSGLFFFCSLGTNSFFNYSNLALKRMKIGGNCGQKSTHDIEVGDETFCGRWKKPTEKIESKCSISWCAFDKIQANNLSNFIQ